MNNPAHEAKHLRSFKTLLIRKVLLVSVMSWILFLAFFAISFESNRQEHRDAQHTNAQQQLEALLNDTSNLLKVASKHISHLMFQDISPYTISKQQQQQRLDQTWQNLDLSFSNHVEMRHYTKQGLMTNFWKDNEKQALTLSQLSEPLLDAVLASPKGINTIRCETECYISHFRSLAPHTNHNGLIELRASMQRFIGTLSALTHQNIFLVKPTSVAGRDLMINNMSYALDNATSVTSYSQIIRQQQTFLSSKYDELSIDSEPHELQFMTPPANYTYYSDLAHTPYFILATNIALDKQHFNNFISNIIIGSILIMLVTLYLTYHLLGSPMRQLLRISEILPMIGKGQFSEAKQALQKAPSAERSHELQKIHTTAKDLTHQLETLHTELATKNQELEKALAAKSAAHDYFHDLLDTAEAMMLTCNADNQVTMCNKYALEYLGTMEYEVLGKTFEELFLDNENTATKNYEALPQKADQILKRELPFTTLDGRELLFSWTHNTVTKPNGELSIFSIGIDITDRLAYERHIQHLADHDFLTKLYNRRYFSQHLPQLTQTAKTVTLIYVDINHFKLVNDMQGHAIGDQLLIRIKDVLQAACPENTLIARIGGDEFGIALCDKTQEETQTIAETIIQQIAQLHESFKTTSVRKVTASIGIACYPKDSDDMDKLASFADAAMYENKKTRSGSYHFYTGEEIMLRRIRDAKHWNDIVREALAENRIHAYFQPVVHTNSMTVSHYEVLARLVDDQQKPLYSPAQFIEHVEKSQLIVEFDKHIINEALEQAHTLSPKPTLMMNLSNVTMASEGTTEYILERIQHYQYPKNKVVFEITETSAINDIEQATQFINCLRREGIRFALDDFGTGYSSISYLQQLPVDFLKIDRSLVQNLLSDDKAPEVLKSILLLTRSYNMKVIAEGIEHSEFIDLIKELGIEYMQGFYFAKAQKSIPEVNNKPIEYKTEPAQNDQEYDTHATIT